MTGNTTGAARPHHASTRALLLCLASVALAGCSSTSDMFGSAASSVTSVGDRFSELFGSKSQAVGEAPPPAEAGVIDCPTVEIRNGASTMVVGVKGVPTNNSEVRYQLTLARTARECAVVGGQFTAKVGVQGRVVVGPAGAPPTVDVPIRVAAVQEGPEPKTLFSKVYITKVAITSDNTAFSFVAEDVAYPVPSVDVAGAYVYYVGFDPEGLKPKRSTKPTKKKKR